MLAINFRIFSDASVLILLANPDFLKQVIFMCVHVRDPSDQGQCLGHIPYLLLNGFVHIITNKVHDVDHALTGYTDIVSVLLFLL